MGRGSGIVFRDKDSEKFNKSCCCCCSCWNSMDHEIGARADHWLIERQKFCAPIVWFTTNYFPLSIIIRAYFGSWIHRFLLNFKVLIFDTLIWSTTLYKYAFFTVASFISFQQYFYIKIFNFKSSGCRSFVRTFKLDVWTCTLKHDQNILIKKF